MQGHSFLYLLYAMLTFHAYYSGTEIKPYYIITMYALYTYVIISNTKWFADVKNAILTIKLASRNLLYLQRKGKSLMA